MATLYVIGNTLVNEGEYVEKLALGEIDDLLAAKAEGKAFRLEFQNAAIEASDLDFTPGPVISYNPIGIGRPLSAEILCLYTGDFISGFLAGRKRDLLCVSGVKKSSSFDAAARAINILEPNARERQYLEFAALKACTPFAYYAKAVDAEGMVLSFELDGDSFNEDIFQTISDLMGDAAGIPLFMPASGYLLAGSQLAKIITNGGNALFESSPFLNSTISIRFATPGMSTYIARSMVICREEHSKELLGYEARVVSAHGNQKMRLVNKDTGTVYSGKAPYMIVNIDGTERNDLASFASTVATNDLLRRFYGESNKLEQASKILFEATTLYNDLTYKKKADSLWLRLSLLPPEGAEYKRLRALYDAYVANIQNDIFKPDHSEKHTIINAMVNSPTQEKGASDLQAQLEGANKIFLQQVNNILKQLGRTDVHSKSSLKTQQFH